MDMDMPNAPAAHGGPIMLEPQPPDAPEWKYEMRRECQEIIPGLILGPYQASKDLPLLQQLGVTHIICIRGDMEAHLIRPRFPDNFRYLVLDVRDSEEQNLIRVFPQARDFIHAARSAGGRVLIVCNGGISRGPAVTIMYVMEAAQVSFEDALQHVQNRRYCISPNIGFQAQIKEYEPIYRAAMAVAQRPPGAAPQPKRRERDDSDEELDERPTQNLRT